MFLWDAQEKRFMERSFSDFLGSKQVANMQHICKCSLVALTLVIDSNKKATSSKVPYY